MFFINAYINNERTVSKIEINDFITIIGNMGFPVAISAYLLIRLEKHLISLTSSINLLNTIVSTKLGVVIDGK